jgi:dTDP-glucose pyrophosphorylase
LEGQEPGLPVLIFNADSAFDDDLETYVANLPPITAGFLQVFTDTDERWSFVCCDDDMRVTAVAEKIPISNNACTGLYYFRSASLFLSLFDKLPRIDGGELFVAPMYNELVKRGELVLAKPVRKYWCFGTPEDYRRHVAGGAPFTYKGPVTCERSVDPQR